MKISDPAKIKFSDIYRLPQHSIKKNEKSVRGPIVKLQTMFNKDLIFKSAENLKEYNAKGKNNENINLNAYIRIIFWKSFKGNESFHYHFIKKRRRIKQKLKP